MLCSVPDLDAQASPRARFFFLGSAYPPTYLASLPLLSVTIIFYIAKLTVLVIDILGEFQTHDFLILLEVF